MAIAQSASIDRTKLLSQSYANIYNLINDRNNISDPKGYANRKFVYTKVPDMEGRGWKLELFPFIVVKSPKIKQEDFTLAVKNARVNIEVEVEVYSNKDMGGKHAGKGYTYFESIIDNLLETINSWTNKSTLRGYVMQNVRINMDDNDTIEMGNNTVYLAAFTITFSTRMVVSS